MDKSSFRPHTRYTLTWQDAEGKLRPINIYVYQLYDKFMIARMTEKDGLLYKIAYDDIIKIVHERAVEKEDQFYIPAAVLDEKAWQDRSVMQRYSTSPAAGK